MLPMRRTRWVAPAVVGLTAATTVAALTLKAVDHGASAGLDSTGKNDLVLALWGAAYAAAGGLIAFRRPGIRVGWLLLGAGFVLAAATLAFEYADAALGPRHLAGGAEALWVNETPSTFALALIPFALLVFPDGRLPGARWRPLAWLCFGAIACLFVGIGFEPGRMDPSSDAVNPVGIGGLGTALDGVQAVGWLLVIVTFLGAGSAMLVRLRTSDQALRQQMKWVVYAASVLGVVWGQWSIVILWPVGNSLVVAVETVAVTVAMAGVPAAMGIAILRHRLYDIDVIIRRTLVYALLVAALSGVYAVGVLGLTEALRVVTGGSGALVVTLSTLAVAAAFQPLRVRLQHVVDHRFYRDKYDAAKTLDAFGRRLREQVDLDALRAGILEVVETTVQPRQATLWLAPAADEPDDVSPGGSAARPAAG
jgi:hypothetical protein